jgi:PAS domain S-box-containing protein
MSTTKMSATKTTSPLSQKSTEHQAHVVQFYSDERFLLDELSNFVGAALVAGGSAVAIASKSHQEGLSQKLTDQGLNLADAIAAGRYVALDAAETLARIMVNGQPDGVRFSEVIGSLIARASAVARDDRRRVVVFGEMVAMLWGEGKFEAAIQLEKLWNQLAKTHAFSLRCAYPMQGFCREEHADSLLQICAEHSGVVPDESYSELTSEEERLRSVVRLQQRMQVLLTEIESRRKEEQFRVFVEAVSDYAIFMLDPEGRVTTWNTGAERIKGYKAAEIIGKHFSCFYHEEDIRSGKPSRELEAAVKEGRLEDEGWRLRKDGSSFWANVIITPVRDQNNKVIGFAKVTRDVTERMQKEKSLRDLTSHLLQMQDEERRRIGRDLHDTLGQCVTAMKISLDSLAINLGPRDTGLSRQIMQCVGLAEECVKEVRTLSYLLYPPMLEEMGLKSAIPWYLEGFTARSGIQVSFDVPSDFPRLSRDTELALFRVLQESLTNVHRHSGSQTAHVQLGTTEGTAVLEIRDDGKGIPSTILEDAADSGQRVIGVGLRGMRERIGQLGGKLDISSTQNGATVTASVPLAECAQAADDSQSA